ncbi:hypothetical protein N7491_003845 [Penicillium cf. griseofulvum]|uniref:Gfo/Idh/MocA-like oxidoreductase C-terminal domain-containing protein n=1 Tax=Penicillium cf. griseofulvum TaxID=2972120 RepID=A0A9W9MQB9_9EURO|nr:hypothetical protein N7472_001975 [Penicillium cf. griseofulvum]KAJ5437294.1 hypothetical protein N7445_005838 [Penicillium cf. griseofulvum]KAJ5441439.1 hypothetical protein N7491_003845 [Penicillium cf. griseofulvum]
MARSKELTPTLRSRICELHDIGWGYRQSERRDSVSKPRLGRLKKPTEANTTWLLKVIEQNPRVTQEDLLTKDVFEIRDRDTGKIVRRWEEKTHHKAYTFKEAGGEFANLPGESYWMSYRHQLEQFVNRVKGRKTQAWVDGKDSIAQMKILDLAYEKSGLGPRPTSSFR